MNRCCLVFVEVSFSVAIGVVKHHSVGAACRAENGDNHRLLHGSVHHTVMNEVACGIVNLDIYVTEASVEMEVDRIFIGTSYDSVWTDTGI